MKLWSTPGALWQRNLIAGTIVAAVLATLWFTTLGPGVSRYRGAVVPEHVVAKGEASTINGVTWRVADIRYLDRSGTTRLPAGTVLHVVTVERDGGGAGPPCTGVLTDGARRWNAEQLSSYAVAPAPGTTTNCLAPGPVQFSFLMPGDAVATGLDVLESGRITVRLLR